jgi:hypothetical protein
MTTTTISENHLGWATARGSGSHTSSLTGELAKWVGWTLPAGKLGEADEVEPLFENLCGPARRQLGLELGLWANEGRPCAAVLLP